MPCLSSCASRPRSEQVLSGTPGGWGGKGSFPERWVTACDGFFLLARGSGVIAPQGVV